MNKIKNILVLGMKELVSLRYDYVLIFLIIYGYTVLIYIAASDESLDLRNASIAFVDEDRSQLSARIFDAFVPPNFQYPRNISFAETKGSMDSGLYTFVVDIPPDFQADIVAGKNPEIQVLVDATAMSQAGIGVQYITSIINEEVDRYFNTAGSDKRIPVIMAVRVKFNPNMEGSWFTGVMEIINITTLLGILITGAAFIREREHGTIDHLLSMPLTPWEIIIAKFWTNGLVIIAAILISLFTVIQSIFDVQIQGSILLFLAGTVLYLFSTMSIGVFLSTIARSMPQLGLLCILVVFPILLLSGGYTPLDTMPVIIDIMTTFSPTRHFVSFAQSVLFRGGGIEIVWGKFVAVTAIGIIFSLISLYRFRKSVSVV